MSTIKELIKPDRVEYGADETVAAFDEGRCPRLRTNPCPRLRRCDCAHIDSWLWSDREVEDDVLF